jgi:L-fucose mutarotase
MLKGISPFMSPELLSALYRMGHGDEIVLADAHFPGHSIHQQVIRADGLRIHDLLNAILPLFPLDTYVRSPLIMMEAVTGDTLDPKVEAAYQEVIEQHVQGSLLIERMERFAFYERARRSYAVVMTGETAKYGNIILKKGVVPT